MHSPPPIILLTVVLLPTFLGCSDHDTSDPLPDVVSESAAPTEPETLHAWLRAGGYLGWEAESRVFETGGHGGARVHVNKTLLTSLRDGQPLHPVGSAAVREMYEPDMQTLRGFAAIIKTSDDLDGDGDDWLWFEVFTTEADAAPAVFESGASGCVFCHSQGTDFVQSPYPLR